ncbi:MAG: fructosamine kinase family protein [Nitrosomonadales bacterium]|nr:fructosamine kinase family protein [Nitrosomonadales bacterium]
MTPAIESALHCILGAGFDLQRSVPLSGGCINQAFRLEGRDGSRYFIKLNAAEKLPMFATEHAGLAAMADTHSIRVPRPITHGITGNQAFLLLEWLELHEHGDARMLGERLASLHQATAPGFGFAQDNFIGNTPQPNGWLDDWVEFWQMRRLGFQLELAAQNGYRFGASGERLLTALPAFFKGYTPRPALLHGDLWSGNHSYLGDGSPVLFDPAPYYGDHEADLAMTELFGGFSPDFYAAYRSHVPLDAGYPVRRELYNLYHILNHANLFGAGYAKQAEDMMRRLLTEIG